MPLSHSPVIVRLSVSLVTQAVIRPRSRVCGVSLLAYDQGTMRTLLTVADTRKSTTAEDGNSKTVQV